MCVDIAAQFVRELRNYGFLLWTDPAAAKDVFFFSFSGSVVYGSCIAMHSCVTSIFGIWYLRVGRSRSWVPRVGHGTPREISKALRGVAAVLSDALFLIICLRLLQVRWSAWVCFAGCDLRLAM